MRLEPAEVGGKFGALLDGLAHADEAAAAEFHPGGLDHLAGLPTLLPRVGGDDVGEEGLAGFEVVVVAVHTHRDEVVDLTLGEHAEGGGDVDVDRGADRGDALAHLLHELVVRAADGGDDAELTRAGRGGLLGGAHELGDVEPHGAHRRGELARLRAEVAVLRAAPGLERDDPLDLDARPLVLHPHLVRQRQQVREPVVPGAQDLDDLRLRQRLTALEHLCPGDVEDVGRGFRRRGHAPLLAHAVVSARAGPTLASGKVVGMPSTCRTQGVARCSQVSLGRGQSSRRSARTAFSRAA